MLTRITTLSVVAVLSGLLVPAVSAKDGDVLVRGVCSSSSTLKLKLSPEDGRIEVEFEVDQNRNGVRWTVVLRRATRVVARGARVTRPPSGSLELRRIVSNRPGRDRISARATSRFGEVCRATARF
ncbi:MAG: hypothetical protein ACRDNY_04000 [Gaiellaceae bacterium]